MWRGGGGAFGVAAITSGTARFDDGTQAAPSVGPASSATSGFYWTAGNVRVSVANGTVGGTLNGAWYATTFDVSGNGDALLSRPTAMTLLLGSSANSDLIARKQGGNGGYVEWGSISENLTLSTGGATTDTAGNLLPANSYIESVTARVTVTITTATDWKLGDATISGRFTAALATLVAGTTNVGLVHIDQTGTSGPRQTAAAKIRVTTTGTPGAGAIRITSYYRTYVPATS